MKVYEVGIIYRFDADDADHAIEQMLDAVIHPDNREAAIDSDVESAINHIQELPARDAPSRFT